MKQELIETLWKGKKQAIKQKKALPTFGATIGTAQTSQVKTAVPSVKMEHQDDGTAVIVDVVANMLGYMDSQDDVLLSSCFNKSLADKGSDFPFLRDHDYSTKAIIADTLEVYYQKMNLAQLGVSSRIEQGTALMFKGRVVKDYAPDIYAKYKGGAIKQHSIGLQYLKIDLAINNPDYEEEFRNWQTYASQVINLGLAEEKGYFWAVQEAKLIENSAVLFGANPITPTISVEEESKGAEISHPEKQAKAGTTATFDIHTFLNHL